VASQVIGRCPAIPGGPSSSSRRPAFGYEGPLQIDGAFHVLPVAVERRPEASLASPAVAEVSTTVPERTLADFAQACPDALVLVDASGIIRFWNAGATRLFGYSEGEALGRTLDIIIPERLRQRHWDAFHSAVAAGASHYGPGDVLAVPAITCDGATVSVEFTIAILKQADGLMLGASIRDVSERRRREVELRNRVKELEDRLSGSGGP